MKKVLILAPLTTAGCAPYVQAAEDLGIKVYFAISSKVSYEQTFLDKHHVLRIVGIENCSAELVNAAHSLGPIDAVIAGGEFTVAAADYLAEKLRLGTSMNGNPLILRNKSIMRKVFSQHTIPQPKLFGSVHSVGELRELLSKLTQYPVISKPSDMAGSWNVAKNHTADEVEKNATPIFLSKEAFGMNFAGECLIEEFVSGEEYSAEIVVRNSEISHLFVTRKFLSLPPNFDEIGHLSGPNLLSKEVSEQVDEVARKVVSAAKVCNSIVHMEFKLSEKREIKVIEAGCRVGGDRISTLVHLAFGFNLEKAMLLVKLGLDPIKAQADNFIPEYYGVKFMYAGGIPLHRIGDERVVQASIEPDRDPDENFSCTHFANRIGYQIIRAATAHMFTESINSYITNLAQLFNKKSSEGKNSYNIEPFNSEKVIRQPAKLAESMNKLKGAAPAADDFTPENLENPPILAKYCSYTKSLESSDL